MVIIIFILLIIVTTFPLILKVTTHIPGFFSTDEPFAALWDSWRIKYSFLHNLSLKQTSLFAYPFGVDLYASGYFSYLWMGWHYLLSLLTTPILTWNIQNFLNLFLSTLFTYLLVFYLTQNRSSAILGGLIFAFCPYQFMRIWQHLGLSYNQWIPLALLSLIWLKDNLSKKTKVIFFLSLLLLFSFDWSIMYLATIVILTFFLYILFYNWKIKLNSKKLLKEDIDYLKSAIAVGLLSFIILLPQFFPVIKNRLKFSSTTPASAFNLYHRPFEDLFTQSAKPLSYFLPAIVHPLFGKFTERFIGTQLYGESVTEHTLYLGWTPLILAFFAFRRWRKRKIGTVPCVDSPYLGFFVLLAIVAWFFSQAPWWKIGPLKIYMPSFFMYRLVPMFRAYCRFGIVLMLAVAVLAGFGLKFILDKFKTQRIKIAITTLFCCLVLFEFWNWPPYKVIDVSKVPAVYYWLKSQPGDFVIAEYPLDAESPSEMYKFYQTVHERKMINGTIPGTYANKVAQTIRKLSEPRTATILKGMNVKYVLVHKDDYLKTELKEEIEEVKLIPHNPGLRLVKSFPAQNCPKKDIMCVAKTGPIDVYEVK